MFIPPNCSIMRKRRMNGDASERDSVVDCSVHAVVPYFHVLCVSEGKSTNIFPIGQIIYDINDLSINVLRSE